MYKAKEIALWFIYKTNSEINKNQSQFDEYEIYEGITHLKLQKLLYYAQGVSLAINNESLFKDKIMAWQHGPVIEDVYEEYKINGRNCIPVTNTKENNESVNKIELDSKTSNILNMVYNNFAIYTAWQLREMTHEIGSPWDITVQNKGINSVIDINLIKQYFNEKFVED